MRAISYTVHGLIPASCVFADRYNREEVVRSLGKEINLNPPLTLGQLPDTPEELLKLDQVCCCWPIRYSVIVVMDVFFRTGAIQLADLRDQNINQSVCMCSAGIH